MSRQRTKGVVRRAFTIIELVIVVLVTGILAAVAAPRFTQALMYHRAESAGRRVKADLELARNYAMATSSNQAVSFQVDSDVYVLAGLPNLNRPGQVYEVSLSAPPFSAALQSAKFSDDADSDVQFNGYGIPDSGGTIVVQAGVYQTTITLDQQTGQVVIP